MVVEQSMPPGVVPLPTGPAADPTRTAAALLAALPDDVRSALQALTRQEETR